LMAVEKSERGALACSSPTPSSLPRRAASRPARRAGVLRSGFLCQLAVRQHVDLTLLSVARRRKLVPDSGLFRVEGCPAGAAWPRLLEALTTEEKNERGTVARSSPPPSRLPRGPLRGPLAGPEFSVGL